MDEKTTYQAESDRIGTGAVWVVAFVVFLLIKQVHRVMKPKAAPSPPPS